MRHQTWVSEVRDSDLIRSNRLYVVEELTHVPTDFEMVYLPEIDQIEIFVPEYNYYDLMSILESLE